MTEKNQGRGSESHVNNGNLGKRDMTDHGREPGRERGGIVTKQKREKEREQGIERSQKRVIGGVEAEIGHLTDEKAGSQDIPRIIHLRWVLI